MGTWCEYGRAGKCFFLIVTPYDKTHDTTSKKTTSKKKTGRESLPKRRFGRCGDEIYRSVGGMYEGFESDV